MYMHVFVLLLLLFSFELYFFVWSSLLLELCAMQTFFRGFFIPNGAEEAETNHFKSEFTQTEQ